MSTREIIVVDIGNSGLKAAKIRLTIEDTRSPNAMEVIPEVGPLAISRLAWSDDWAVVKPSSDSTYPVRGESFERNTSHTAKSADPSDWKTLLPWVQSWYENAESRPAQWWISSVHRGATDSLRLALQEVVPENDTHWISYREVPMETSVDEPQKLGIDRLLSGWFAWVSSSQNEPLIVIEAGTAVTVDWVSAAGIFRGGAILAGIPLVLKLMATGTDQLPRLQSPEDFLALSLPGKNTQQAMSVGAAASVLGGVVWIVQEYRRLYGENTLAVISGGDGPSVAHYVPGPRKTVDHLVLRALAELARRSNFAGYPQSP